MILPYRTWRELWKLHDKNLKKRFVCIHRIFQTLDEHSLVIIVLIVKNALKTGPVPDWEIFTSIEQIRFWEVGEGRTKWQRTHNKLSRSYNSSEAMRFVLDKAPEISYAPT